jgi:hypothetical protein
MLAREADLRVQLGPTDGHPSFSYPGRGHRDPSYLHSLLSSFGFVLERLFPMSEVLEFPDLQIE